MINSGNLRHKIDVYGKVITENELGETDYTYNKIKTIWASIIPQTGALQKQQTENILTNITHKVITRYNSGKEITTDMYFMFQGKRFDIKFILNPYFKNETLEIFVTEVIE
ncbi:phage head closure protein [Schinkia azotoformans]|uniref:phage head closure protein n=1 Tax=Schinkia azotoformans TaxID=1454 RepID=UPI002DB689C8|nr:phage head closure protein [Schinkia azotoformans]MEC1757382.1 phage head closure protein [Schinkia azotoformans]